MSSTSSEVMDYGHRLMPAILSFESQSNPNRVFALSTKSSTVEDGFHEITFEQVGRASSYVAQWLSDHFRLEAGSQGTIAYLGVSDLRYNVMFYGTLQLRSKVSLISFFRSSIYIPQAFPPFSSKSDRDQPLHTRRDWLLKNCLLIRDGTSGSIITELAVQSTL